MGAVREPGLFTRTCSSGLKSPTRWVAATPTVIAPEMGAKVGQRMAVCKRGAYLLALPTCPLLLPDNPSSVLVHEPGDREIVP